VGCGVNGRSSKKFMEKNSSQSITGVRLCCVWGVPLDRNRFDCDLLLIVIVDYVRCAYMPHLYAQHFFSFANTIIQEIISVKARLASKHPSPAAEVKSLFSSRKYRLSLSVLAFYRLKHRSGYG
jgi:hypothetical protein